MMVLLLTNSEGTDTIGAKRKEKKTAGWLSGTERSAPGKCKGLRGTGCQGITDFDRVVFICFNVHAGSVCLHAEGLSGQVPDVPGDLIRLQAGAADFKEQGDIPVHAVFHLDFCAAFCDMSVKEHGVQMGHGSIGQ